MVSRRTLIIGGAAVVVVAGIAYAATSGSKGGSSDKFTAAVVSDTNGVNDKGFNQSAWEGLEKWGKANNLSKGQNGYKIGRAHV